jgi:hypothetical protein
VKVQFFLATTSSISDLPFQKSACINLTITSKGFVDHIQMILLAPLSYFSSGVGEYIKKQIRYIIKTLNLVA